MTDDRNFLKTQFGMYLPMRTSGQTLNSYYKLYFVKYYRCIYRYF